MVHYPIFYTRVLFNVHYPLSNYQTPNAFSPRSLVTPLAPFTIHFPHRPAEAAESSMQTSGASFVALRGFGSMASFRHGVKNKLGLIIIPDCWVRWAHWVRSKYYFLLILSFLVLLIRMAILMIDIISKSLIFIISAHLLSLFPCPTTHLLIVLPSHLFIKSPSQFASYFFT
ncbi:hypothetical protein F5Y11DRAFT_103303 [Daldinia sp. FL1419]|nr:hypothetical protein F5Y11DRAFT_103303 [Daldinia sp. FL1419]